MLPEEIKRIERKNVAVESQLSVIQNVLNPGKQVSNITSSPLSPYFPFLQPHIVFIPSEQ